MRTTLTLEPDVVERIERLRQKQRATFKQIVNDALRQGLAGMLKNPSPTLKYTRPHDGGKARIENLDCISEVLEQVEGPGWR